MIKPYSASVCGLAGDLPPRRPLVHDDGLGVESDRFRAGKARRARRMNRLERPPPTAPVTRAAAARPYPTGRAPRSPRSAGTGGPGQALAPRIASATTPCAPPPRRPGVAETLNRNPRPQPDRGLDALPGSARAPWPFAIVARSDGASMAQPRPPDRRKRHPHPSRACRNPWRPPARS